MTNNGPLKRYGHFILKEFKQEKIDYILKVQLIHQPTRLILEDFKFKMIYRSDQVRTNHL